MSLERRSHGLQIETKDYLHERGVRTLTIKEMFEISEHYQRELTIGIGARKRRSKHGPKVSLAMYPSLLEPVSRMTSGEALIVEIGGTNVYGARVRVDNGHTNIVAHQEEELGKTVFKSADDFYSTIAMKMIPILRAGDPDALGIVFSFPGSPRRNPLGVDVVSVEDLPKGFVVPGISTQPVGEAFKRTLFSEFGLLSKNVPTVVLNDTVAVAFSTASKLGAVVGTGFNLAVATPKGIINTESGGFDKVPRHEIVAVTDFFSSNHGKGLAEKQISGKYLGEQLNYIITGLRNMGLVTPDLDDLEDEITSVTISKIIRDSLEHGRDHQLLYPSLILARRSAQIVGTMIGTAISTFPEQFDEKYVDIPVEGSVFWGIPSYPERVVYEVERFTDKNLRFIEVSDAGRIGAAVAALNAAAA